MQTVFIVTNMSRCFELEITEGYISSKYFSGDISNTHMAFIQRGWVWMRLGETTRVTRRCAESTSTRKKAPGEDAALV